MTYRKTWFSYVLWAIYTMLCTVFLVFAGNYVCVSYLTDTGIVSGRIIQALGFLTIPVTAAVYWIVRRISDRAGKKYLEKETVRRIVEVIAVWAVFVLGIFVRIVYVLDDMQRNGSAGDFPADMAISVNGMEYFDMALIREGGSLEPLAYGGAYLYVLCLSFVLTFLGNKIVSAIIFQVILQIAGLVLVYAVTRKLAGVIPACTVLLYFACSVSCLEMLKNLGPECLFFVLYMIVLLAAVSYVKGYCANRFRKVQALAGAAATGILTGLLVYLDLTAVTILPVMAAVATGKKKHLKNAPVNTSPVISGTVIVMTVFACTAGFFSLAGIVSLCRGTGFGLELENWAVLHIWNTQTFGFKPLYPYSLDMLWFGVLTALAAFLVLEFFRSGTEQNYMLWILLCILAAPTPLAVFGVQPFGLISMYIWGVLAGLGLQNCIFGGRAKLMRKMIREISQSAEEAELSEEGKQQTEILQTQEGANPAVVLQMEEDGKPTEKTADEKTESAPRPRYLENPLPLPKKHVHRKMDYQYSVEEKDMKFDVEIGEDDDFDL